MSRIMIAGDTHANRSHLTYLFESAKTQDVDRIFVVGDFGYWPRWAGGQRFIKHAEKLTIDYGIELYWLDGNHEDHHAMKSLTPDESGFARTTSPYGEYPGSKVFYSPRGHVWEWDGLRFMSVGGAYSVDKDYRVIGEDYFIEEVITDRDIQRAVSNAGGKQIDVLLTHDTPGVTETLEAQLWRIGRGYKLDSDAVFNRTQLDQIVREVHPRFMFHGHYHLNYTETVIDDVNDLYIKVQGLDRDDSGKESWTILDTSFGFSDDYQWPDFSQVD